MTHHLTRRGFMGTAASAAGAAIYGGDAFAQMKMRDLARDAVRRRRRRQSGADAEGHRGLSRQESEAASHGSNFTKAPAPELPGKIKAQQDAEPRRYRPSCSPATTRLSAGVHQKLWVPIASGRTPRKLPKLDDIYLPMAPKKMQALAGRTRASASCSAIRPVRCSNTCPNKVKTAADHRGRGARLGQGQSPTASSTRRPANSGPGRIFMMGLPYVLGDKDPKDPINGWDKTWAYLKELGENIEYYPAGTGAVMKELGEGSRDMIAVDHHGLGHQPARARRRAEGSQGCHRSRASTGSLDAHYLCVPKGVSARQARRAA